MAERSSAVLTAAPEADGVHAPGRASERSDLAYTNEKPCPCGRPIPAVAPGTKGRRPRFCARCREERKALRFTRAATRILEQLRDPDWDGGQPR